MDFTALKTAIQNAIKLNGNEEITGDILQGVLLSMVSTLGDSAINDLVTAISNEATARQNGDSTLNGYITALQGAVNSINTAIENGFVYAGIATPTTTPATGKVFYIALTAGTYTNFDNTEVSQGINILKYDGSDWSLDVVISFDNAPTPSSNNLVKSGGVFDKVMTDGSAFDISAHFASGGTLATYADLSAALTALNTLSASYKKGGMSIKFVQSSDNKYVQSFCTANEFTTDVTQWQGVDDEPFGGSKNLVKSGGVFKNEFDVSKNLIFEIDKVVLENGNTSNASGWCYSKRIYLSKIYDLENIGIKILKGSIRSNFTYNIYSACFFNSEGVSTGTSSLNLTVGGSIPYSSIPANSEYVRFNSEGGNHELLIENYGQEGTCVNIERNKKSIEDNTRVLLEKINIASTNLVHTFNVDGKGIRINGSEDTDANLHITDYIPVKGQNIISNAWHNEYWSAGNVYNANKQYIRTIGDTNQYTYQEGDYYVRLSFIKTSLPRANYGTTLKPYTEYNPIEGYLESVKKEIATLNDSLKDKVNVNTVNLVHNFTTEGQMINASGNITSSYGGSDGHITDYIEVKGQNIICNAWHNEYWSAGNVYDSDKNYLRTIGDTNQYTYQEGDYYVRLSYTSSNTTPQANYGTVLEPYSEYNPIEGYLGDVEDRLETLENDPQGLPYEVAVGNKTANGSYQSELEASCIYNSINDAFVKYKRDSRSSKRNYSNLKFIVVNHDDLALSDYVGTRKIYNKYGFNANFNYILKPFSDINNQKTVTENIKKLIEDGNDLGLHAILGKSYWWLNKCFDIRPDSTFTFAPILSEIQGENSDHTGVNAFGDTITATTKVSEIGFIDMPTAELRNLLVVNLTTNDMVDVIRCYSIYGDYQYLITGLDLDGNSVSKTTLQWLEYWYNNLIDDTLGYSSTETNISAKYSEDYTGTYPSVSEIKSGVFTSDGVFTKGLFKGCKTCLNYEVTDRILEVAKAFSRHYFGTEKFSNFGRHGVGFFERTWMNWSTGISYDNRDKTILSNEAFKTYNSRKQCWESQFDALISVGIRICNHVNPIAKTFEGQVGLYFGQDKVRSDFFASADVISYWNFFGTNLSEGYDAMPYSDFSTFLDGVDDWLQFAFDNAGQSVTRNGKTFTVFSSIANVIKLISNFIDTGRVPFFSVDTIRNNPAIMQAIELICRYCYMNSIRIVPLEEAREILSSRSRGYKDNWFPNPAFNQGIYTFFNGNITAISGKIPDGWIVGNESLLNSVVVNTQTIQDESMRVLTIESSEATTLHTKIYGLPSGKYKFSFIGKSTDMNGAVSIYKKYNKDYIANSRNNPISTKYLNAEYTQYEVEFAIEAPHKNSYDGEDAINVICQGYEDNVANIMILLYMESDISIANPSLISI